MSNPTTPFGWQMPTNTDLVTDLPADFEVFGQAVATSMADLLGGTTGQVLAKTTATDMDFTWTTPQVGDITGVTAGTGISGGGTSGTVTVTNSMATAITTNGDIIYGTGSGTFNRLGIGSTGQVLTVAGGIPSYATPATGGMTLLSTTTLSGTTTTISSINQTYVDLQIYINNMTTSASAITLFRPNSNTSSGRYTIIEGGNTPSPQTEIQPFGRSLVASNSASCSEITIFNYAHTNGHAVRHSGDNPSQANGTNIGGGLCSLAAITSIAITTLAGTATLGGTVLIYGVK